MNKVKKLLLILCAILLLFPSTTYGLSQSFYVDDQANVLSDHAKDSIIKLNKSYQEKAEKPQVVFVTVDDLGKSTLEKYATSTFEKKKIGNAKYNNGVLLVLSPKNRSVRIEVGCGLEGALTDGKCGQIIDEAHHKLAKGKYSKAAIQILHGIAKEINKEYNYTDIEIPKTSNKQSISNSILNHSLIKKIKAMPLWLILLMGIALVILLSLDIIVFGGLITRNVIRVLMRHITDDDDDKSGGGLSGGGGASRGF